MCGLVGLIYKNQKILNEKFAREEERTAAGMLQMLRLRGPDECRLIRKGAAILGHTRLSIIDLHTGSQPVFNEDGSVAVILNGEIYNFRDLRINLQAKGHVFRTESDTEVIVHLYEEYGENLFSHLNGMFAVIVYDSKTGVVLAGRDRMGEKPLVYYESPDVLILASEVKSILKYPDVKKEIDSGALALYMNCMYVPAPLTIFQGIRKVLPAHYLKMSVGRLTEINYWNPRLDICWDMPEEIAKERFLELFDDAVKMRTVSDVPIGVFLSGGIDSSAVTAFMAQNCREPIRTFSVGFADEIDERPYAKLVAERYRTEHTEILVRDRIEDVLENVIGYFDEPFGDSSAIPTHLVAREARKHVKVILTGDGGDELFAGYNSYIDQKYLWGGRFSSYLLKRANRFFLNMFNVGLLDRLYSRTSNGFAMRHWLWVRTICTQSDIASATGNGSPDLQAFFKHHQWLPFTGTDPLSVAFAHDFNFYLPDDLLKKVDMASMMTSLECRAPFLDHRLVELSLQIPPNLKVKNDRLKHLLKTSLVNYLPDAVLNRPKMGFGAPVGSWLRNQLGDMTRDLLCGPSHIESFVDRSFIEKSISSVYSQEIFTNYRQEFRLWLLLVLEIWMRRYMQKPIYSQEEI